MDPTQEQLEARLRDSGLDINQPTVPFGTVTTSDLAPVSPPNLAPVSPLTVPSISAIPVTDPAPYKPPETGTLVQDIEQATLRLLGRGAETERRIGVATAETERQLNEINRQIRMLQAESIESQERIRRSGGDVSFQAGESQRVARTNAIEAMKLSAIAEALQGNLVLAERQARRAVDAEFAEAERDLKVKRQNIIQNWDRFTEAEKSRALDVLEDLDKQDSFVKKEKEKKRMIETKAIEAAATGRATNVQLQEIQNAPDEVTAARLAAPFLKDPEVEKEQALRRRLLQAQVAKAEAEKDLVVKSKVIDVGGKKILINTQTGEIIQDFGGVADDPSISNLVRAATTVVRDAGDALYLLGTPGFTGSFAVRGITPTKFTGSGVFQASARVFASKIRGTPEFELNNLISSIKSNVGIDTLLNIKREGSGLGQVPQSQLETLQEILGRLDIGRDPALLRRDIQDINSQYQDIIRKAGGAIGTFNVQTMSDGTQWQQNSDGTFTRIR